MDLLEHQGKRLLADSGVPVLRSQVAATPDQAVAAAGTIGYPVAVKAQIRAGGRGKAGGIRVVTDPEACQQAAAAILAMSIGGLPVHQVLVEEGCRIDREWYCAFTFDRSARTHVALLSAEGGVDIEQVSSQRPDALARVPVDPIDGLDTAGARRLIGQAEIGAVPDGVAGELAGLLVTLFRTYVAADAQLIEINPLVLTAGGHLVALDAKVSLDDSAAFRHPDWAEWVTDDAESDPRERQARAKGLNYVGLDGTVGVIGNGAGLVMSTLDLVARAGGSPANFLDVGGGASAEVMAAALDVVASDPKVGAIFVNVFGGITRGDEVARGILDALANLDLSCPIVVRLDGTNAEEGRALLAEHESDRLLFRPTMAEAAALAVALAR